MNSWVGTIHWRRDRLPTPVFLGFPCGSAGKESACIVGGLGSIPGLGRSLGKGKGYPLQDYGLENSMNCVVHGVAKSLTHCATFTFTSRLTWLPASRVASHHTGGIQVEPRELTELKKHIWEHKKLKAASYQNRIP